MARILRGVVRWADLNPVRGQEQAGQRPVLILSHDVFNERSVLGQDLARSALFPSNTWARDLGVPPKSNWHPLFLV